jgi:hypothetical protein
MSYEVIIDDIYSCLSDIRDLLRRIADKIDPQEEEEEDGETDN